jgi:hypothetical protein
MGEKKQEAGDKGRVASRRPSASRGDRRQVNRLQVTGCEPEASVSGGGTEQEEKQVGLKYIKKLC